MERQLKRFDLLAEAEQRFLADALQKIFPPNIDVQRLVVYGWSDLNSGWALHIYHGSELQNSLNLSELEELVPDPLNPTQSFSLFPVVNVTDDALEIFDPGERFDWPNFEAIWRIDMPSLLPQAVMAFQDFGLSIDLLCPRRRPKPPRWSKELWGKELAPNAPNSFWALPEEPHLVSVSYNNEDDLRLQILFPESVCLNEMTIDIAVTDVCTILGHEISRIESSQDTLSLLISRK